MGPWFSPTITMIGLFSTELAMVIICSVTFINCLIENNLLKVNQTS